MQRIFEKRLNELLGRKTVTDFAKELDISRPTISGYLNGARIPDSAIVKQICEKCNCSADWLLGLSDVKTPSADVRAVAECTGLSEEAVNGLLSVTDKEFLSRLFESRLFVDEVLFASAEYVRMLSADIDYTFGSSEDFRACAALLGQHGFTISDPTAQADAIFSEEVVSGMRSVLLEIILTHSKQGVRNLPVALRGAGSALTAALAAVRRLRGEP